MDFTWLADFIKNFPKKKTKAIIIILIQFILLCIVWWVLEAIIEWVSSKDSIFWWMAETAFYVLICFFWLSWLTDAALDLDDEKEDALNSKWEVLDFLTKSYGKEKEINVKEITADKENLEKLNKIFSNCNWDKSKISKRLRIVLRWLASDWKLKRIKASTYSIVTNS